MSELKISCDDWSGLNNSEKEDFKNTWLSVFKRPDLSSRLDWWLSQRETSVTRAIKSGVLIGGLCTVKTHLNSEDPSEFYLYNNLFAIENHDEKLLAVKMIKETMRVCSPGLGLPNKLAYSHYKRSGFTTKLEYCRLILKSGIMDRHTEAKETTGNWQSPKSSRYVAERYSRLKNKITGKANYCERDEEYYWWRYCEHKSKDRRYSFNFYHDKRSNLKAGAITSIYNNNQELKGHILDVSGFANETIHIFTELMINQLLNLRLSSIDILMPTLYIEKFKSLLPNSIDFMGTPISVLSTQPIGTKMKPLLFLDGDNDVY